MRAAGTGVQAFAQQGVLRVGLKWVGSGLKEMEEDFALAQQGVLKTH